MLEIVSNRGEVFSMNYSKDLMDVKFESGVVKRVLKVFLVLQGAFEEKKDLAIFENKDAEYDLIL